METETLETPTVPDPTVVGGHPPPGLRPTPDPTRSGALWVGGAGVVLLLAAAGVLTAVRWDDIGQSAKLGGLVAITVALLAAGQRFKSTIPMTAQAIFHLGALLIPFDMAAVAILAGRSWQETLLLTSVTSVIAWFGIERAVPSKVLLWCARGAVVALAAGVAAVSQIAMPLALAIGAIIAIALRKPTEAAVWSLIAGVVPGAAFIPWPPRIAGAMLDLGFDELDRWQPLAAGTISTLVLIAVTRLVPRIALAWSAVLIATVTALIALGGFADAQISYLSLAAIFVGLELVALATTRDPLWKPIVDVLTLAAEAGAAVVTSLLLIASVYPSDFTLSASLTSYGVAAALFGLGWLIADGRRLDGKADWLTGLALGSDWPVTTLMFPTALLATVITFNAPAAVIALTALGLAYWMVATWRTGAAYGAIALAGVVVVAAAETAPWVEFALGGAGAAVLMLATQLRIRAKDVAAALGASFAAILVWLLTTQAAVELYQSSWPLVLVLIGAWSLSWIAQFRRADRTSHPADWAGRLTAVVLLVSSLWVEPLVGIALCGSFMALAAVDYFLARRAGAAEGDPLLTTYALAAGAAFGLAGIPITAGIGLSVAAGGAVMTAAGFILVGIALASPRVLELPLGAAAAVVSSIGLLMTLGDPDMFAVGLIAIGCTTMFVGAALRDLVFGVAGYVAVGLGVALQLARWEVTWLEPYLVLPALAALYVGHRFHRSGGNSWAAYAPTIALMSYVAIADRFAGGSGWHAVIAGAIGVAAIIGGGYRKLAGPLVTGSAILTIVVGYESLGPAALVPTWAWLAAGGTTLLAAGVALERSDTTPLERGQQLRSVIATQFS